MAPRFVSPALLVATIACVSWLGWTPAAYSQDRASSESPVLDVSFGGGTVRQYVAAIRAQRPEINVVVDLPEEAIPMPQVQLKGVELQSALKLLDEREVVSDNRVVRMDVRTIQDSSRSNPVFYISATTRTQDSDRNSVMSIRDVLDAGVSADDVLTAMQTALDLFGEATAPSDIRFHEQTGLVIARGNGEQMNIIHHVLDQLRESVRSTSTSLEGERTTIRLNHEMAQLRSQLQELMKQQDELTVQLTVAQTKNRVLEDELAQARQQNDIRSAQAMQYATEIEKLRIEVQHLHGQLQKANIQPASGKP